MPLTGSHLTIDSPDSVSRVIPPTTTIRNTSAATASSQAARERGRGRGVSRASVAMPRLCQSRAACANRAGGRGPA